MPLIKVGLDSNARDYVAWLNGVPDKIQWEIRQKANPEKQETKKVVQHHLSKRGGGVDEGIYKKSFRINDFSQTKWEFNFQVFAKKPHYRLTHLLEYGHDIHVFRWGKGEPTKWGNIGMNFIGRQTKSIPHIEPGQKYANKVFPKLYDEAIEKTLTEGMEKIK